jgi:predicted nucleic acid-binding protein
MPAHLIDTAVIVDLLRGFAPARNWIDNLGDDDRLISVMTAAELLDGCANARAQRQLERELKNFTILAITEAISCV